jgi:hypothetical protein
LFIKTNKCSHAVNPAPRLVADLKPKLEVKVDLDDRAFLFPAAKLIAQLLVEVVNLDRSPGMDESTFFVRLLTAICRPSLACATKWW